MTAPVPMLDVSANNHPGDHTIQWPRVRAAGFQAVIVKCTEGLDYVNPWLERDAKGAEQAGLLVGYYHFSHPGVSGGADQAAYALRAIKGLPVQLGLADDLELTESRSTRDLQSYAKDFHRTALQTVHHSPLYSPVDLLDTLGAMTWGWRLWVPSTLRPRFEVWAWQTTSPAVVNGIGVPTDVGLLHPDESAAPAA